MGNTVFFGYYGAERQGAKGIFLAPGSIFYPNRKSDYPAMRVNVAYATDSRFLRFLSKVSD